MATGDRAEARLLGPVQLSATDSALGSSVSGTYTWIVKQIILCNTTGNDRLVYLGIGNDSATGGTAGRFLHALPIAGYDTLVLDTALVLVGNATAGSSDRIWGYSDSASSVNVTVIGWRKTN
jgi:hypothetical protein